MKHLVVSLMSLIVLSACNNRPVFVTATPAVTPQPPTKYTVLPFQIRIDCLGNPVARNEVMIRELPGLPPAIRSDVIDNYKLDSGGPPEGKGGKLIGWLKPCEIVAVSKLAWSQYDHMFYLYVDNGKIQGWMKEDNFFEIVTTSTS